MSREQDAADQILNLAIKLTMRASDVDPGRWMNGDDFAEAVIHVLSQPDFDPDADLEDIEVLVYARMQEPPE